MCVLYDSLVYDMCVVLCDMIWLGLIWFAMMCYDIVEHGMLCYSIA